MKKVLHSMRWLTFMIMFAMTTVASYAQWYPSGIYIDGEFNNSSWQSHYAYAGNNNGVYTFYNITFSVTNSGHTPQFKFSERETSGWTEYFPRSWNYTTVVSGNTYNATYQYNANGSATWHIPNGTYTIALDLTKNPWEVRIEGVKTPPTIQAFVDHVALTSSSFYESNNANDGVQNSTLKEADLRFVVYDKSTRKELTSGYTITINPPSNGSKIAKYNNGKFSLNLASGVTSGEEVWTAKFEKYGEEPVIVPFDVTCAPYTFVYSAAATQNDIDGNTKHYVWRQNTSDSKVEFYAGDNPKVEQYDGSTNYLIWNNGTNATTPWSIPNKDPQKGYIGSELDYHVATGDVTGYNGSTPVYDETYYAGTYGWVNRKYHPNTDLNAMTEQHVEYDPSTWKTILNTSANKQQVTSTNGIKVTNTDNSTSTKKYFYYSYVYTEDDEFGMPVMGSFYRFYPKEDGRMSIYLVMNGVTDAGQEKRSSTYVYTKCRDRRTYFLNAKSQSLPALGVQDYINATEGVTEAKAQTRSTINPAFFLIDKNIDSKWDNASTGIEDPKWWRECVKQLLTNWVAWGNDIEKKPTKLSGTYEWDSMTETEKQAWKDLATDPEGIHQQPFRNADGSYAVISRAYVKFTLNVKGGETYYVTPTMTKTRLSSVDFFPNANQPTPEDVDFYNGSLPAGVKPTNMTDYELPSGANNWMTPANEGKHFNVTLKDRSFKANTWYSFYFPFNVSVAELQKWFGSDVSTLHFDKVSHAANDTELYLHLKKHFYPQICAGSPIFIRTGNTLYNNNSELAAGEVKFSNLYYRHNVHSEKYTSKDDRDVNWVFEGSYIPTSMGTNSYFVTGPYTAQSKLSNAVYHVKSEKKTPGNRAWFKPVGAASSSTNAAIIKGVTVTGFSDELIDDDDATAIMALAEEMGLNVRTADDCIYNVSGQLVGRGDDFESLPKGLYIINGKKIMK